MNHSNETSKTSSQTSKDQTPLRTNPTWEEMTFQEKLRDARIRSMKAKIRANKAKGLNWDGSPKPKK